MAELPPIRLSEAQRTRIQLRHKASIERFGYQPQALFWSDQDVQKMRFEVLANLIPSVEKPNHQAWSILDVGCGFADFYAYLVKAGYRINYTGVDVSPDMIYSAGCLHPDIQLFEGELVDQGFEKDSFDFVFLSGALNEVVDETGAYAKSVIRDLYRIARLGVGFNLLNKHNSWIQSRADLQSFYPASIAAFCERFAHKVDWRSDYLANDFSVFLRKKVDVKSCV